MPRRLTSLEIETPHGAARAQVHAADDARAALVMAHGAGGGIDAVDLVAAKDAAVELGVSVALVEQPYRVAGRKAPAPAGHLDAAWLAVIEALRKGPMSGLPLIAGGRSLSARVACRNVEATDAVAVLCLAFPLQPPARKGKEPSPSRLPELEAVKVPVLVVQGENDRFGMPPAGPSRTVAKVAGDHGLKKDVPAVAEAVSAWLPGVI